ncbi:hypothetical protein D3C85_1384090 [compost metagenome]
MQSHCFEQQVSRSRCGETQVEQIATIVDVFALGADMQTRHDGQALWHRIAGYAGLELRLQRGQPQRFDEHIAQCNAFRPRGEAGTRRACG